MFPTIGYIAFLQKEGDVSVERNCYFQLNQHQIPLEIENSVVNRITGFELTLVWAESRSDNT